MKVIAALILGLCSLTLHAQQKWVVLKDASQGLELHRFKAGDRASVETGLRSYIDDAMREGYLQVQIDSLKARGDTLHYGVQKGAVWQWARLSAGNTDELALNQAGYRGRQYQQKPIRADKVADLMQRCLKYYENNGYPFARIRLDSFNLRDKELAASICTEPGALIRIDSLNWRGNAKISRKYLYNYLGIKPGDVYNESKIRQMSQRIREIPFLTEVRDPEVFFIEDLALIRLHLNGRQASNFSGMVGFLPNNDKTGKLLLTGEALVKLRNGLGRGESIDAEWRRLQAETQSLNVKVAWPFLFDLPAGVDGTFNLYKRDTTFINLQQSLGVQYLMQGTNYLKAYFENKSSSLLSTKALQNVLKLPDYADVRSNTYGMEWSYTQLDYRYNPRKGLRILARAGTGIRTIDKNPDLNAALYEGLILRSTQWNGFADADLFVPMFRQSTLNLGLTGGFLFGKSLFENELSRIGGNASLRGFDEESIFASSYSILNVEYRYLMETNSFLFLFANGAWYENKAVNRNVRDLPYGFGAGTSFETAAGIFTISYALGSQFGNPLAFRSAKVHFGITSLF